MTTYIRPKEDQNQWNAFFSVLFAVLLFAAGWFFWNLWGGFPQRVTLFDAVLIALAVMRITRLLVYDKITRFGREWFVNKTEVRREDGTKWIEIAPVHSGPRHAIADLLECPWCVGIWVSLVVVFCYYVFPWAWYIIFILAVAGVGSFFQILANKFGWQAENLKLEAHEKGSIREDVHP